jgi:hypothetical protein
MSQSTSSAASNRLHDVASEYSGDAPRPLGGYLTLMGTFVSLFVGFLLFVTGRGRKLPEGFGRSDLLLLGVATHHFGRMLSKAGVTSPLRAPFTQFQGPSDPPAELKESVRGSGFRHAFGELITCPFCVGLWVAALFSYGLVLAPRVTRLIGSILVIDWISDNLNLIYDATANLATKTPDLREKKAESLDHNN